MEAGERTLATVADADGLPDESAASALTGDPAVLNAFAASSGIDFLRFDVRFDVAPPTSPGATSVPRLALDALRIPFRY